MSNEVPVKPITRDGGGMPKVVPPLPGACTEGRCCKGGQNPTNTSDNRPPAPAGSGGKGAKFGIRRFVKKRTEIEAMQLPMSLATGAEIRQFCEIGVWLGAGGKWTLQGGAKVDIETPEGTMTASPGDWIVKGIKGEFYPVKPDIFDKLHDEITT